MTGFICLNKGEKLTSFSATRSVLSTISEKKGGHTGTLDPMATGVLLIAICGATRFIELLPVHDKAYKAKILLGVSTDTLDITGKVLEQREVDVTKDDIEKALVQFRGKILQTPPMFSALKKDGQRLYDLARKGEEIEREAREITIYSLELLSFNENEFEISVECSVGTYIRSLADDLGKFLGCGACLKALERTKANGFCVESCFSIEELKELSNNGDINKAIIPLDEALKSYEKITVTAPQAIRFKNGGELFLDRIDCSKRVGYYRVYSPEDDFLGIGEIKADAKELSVKRVVSGA